MCKIHESYIRTWRGVLGSVLHWPDQAIDNFIQWTADLYIDPGEGLYHEVAGYYVAQFAIPDRFRREVETSSSTGELVTIHQLERSIADAIDRTLGKEPNYSNEEWERVRRAIVSILIDFDEVIPPFGTGPSIAFLSQNSNKFLE